MQKLKNISCWIITEGMAGTENQCLGVAESLGVSAKILRVTLTQPWKSLSPWLGFEQAFTFSPRLPTSGWPDLLIVSGRKSIAAARYIKKQSHGKTFTVFIQDPRISPKEFDLVIAPEHDPVTGDNVVKTTAAPNRITSDKITQAANSFAALRDMPSPRIAVLIGGNSKAHRLTSFIVEKLCTHLAALTQSLMITTSRRTGAENEEMLRHHLSGHHNVYFWDHQGENPYFAMLALADIIMVTNDSASMLSEAATTGKPVYAIPLEGGGKRIDAMLSRLINRGAVRIFDGKIESWTYEPLNDADKAARAIEDAFTSR